MSEDVQETEKGEGVIEGNIGRRCLLWLPNDVLFHGQRPNLGKACTVVQGGSRLLRLTSLRTAHSLSWERTIVTQRNASNDPNAKCFHIFKTGTHAP